MINVPLNEAYDQVLHHLQTVPRKFLNFRTPENAIIYLKINLRVFRQKDAIEIANGEDPDQTAPLGAV